MDYTAFGEWFRVERIKKHERLYDMEGVLGVSSSFISAVELGKKTIPDSWFEKLSVHYNLDMQEQETLRKAIDVSKAQVKINLKNAGFYQKEAAIVFQRSFDDMDEETAKKLISLFKEGK